MPAAKTRTEIMQSFLQEHVLLGWFCWRPEELLLYLGYVPYWGLSFLLSLHDGEQVLFIPELEPQDTIPQNVTVITYPWGCLNCSNPFAILHEKLQHELKKRLLERTSVGMLRHSLRSSLPILSAEQPSLPEAVLDKLTEGMNATPEQDADFLALYLHKTPAEIECIRLANQAAQQGITAWRAALAPGVTEASAAAAAEAAIHSLIGKHSIHTARAWAMVQSGDNTADAGRFNRTSGRRIKSGELVLIELATCINGYWSDLARTEPVGPISGKLNDLLCAVSVSQQAALRSVAPGVTAHDVDATARESLRQAGFADFFTHATGHHTGFRYHDPGFFIAPDSFDTLQSGMVITIEPGAYVPTWAGARIEDNVALSHAMSDVLSDERNAFHD